VFTVLAIAYLVASIQAPALAVRHGRRVLAIGALVLATGHVVLLGTVAGVGVGSSVALLFPGLVLIGVLLEGVSPELLTPPVNTMRVALHPDGLAPRILNLAQWRGHLLHRLERQLALADDPQPAELLQEPLGYPGATADPAPHSGEIMVEPRLATEGGEVAFFSTVTTFGRAVDITVAELSIEAFFPADPDTAERLAAGFADG
jgi:MmyB-like transcription regulator ligand binding domain